MWILTVPTLNPNCRAISLFDMPVPTKRTTSVSRRVSPCGSHCWRNAMVLELATEGSLDKEPSLTEEANCGTASK